MQTSPQWRLKMEALQKLVNDVVTMGGKVRKERLEMWADEQIEQNEMLEIEKDVLEQQSDAREGR